MEFPCEMGLVCKTAQGGKLCPRIKPIAAHAQCSMEPPDPQHAFRRQSNLLFHARVQSSVRKTQQGGDLLGSIIGGYQSIQSRGGFSAVEPAREEAAQYIKPLRRRCLLIQAFHQLPAPKAEGILNGH